MAYTRRQRKYLKLLQDKYGNDPNVNIYPKPMTDAEFVHLITEYILGKDWYVVAPMGHEQINVCRAADIITKLKSRERK